ncbi:hypothetical protein [Neobacillus rhizophilus]|uniref:Uncharacterized protein n=1 Tax=Neobacillus rhizophilus TaxID=2833579 RepID=A0A942YXR9_9BACI|nr:hypothetical protein [Neobacillus rhizophilus]MBS4214156.1 hypothetical protein [Neobacillus rhizophilus]
MKVMGNLGMLPVPEVVLSDNRSKEFLYREFIIISKEVSLPLCLLLMKNSLRWFKNVFDN